MTAKSNYVVFSCKMMLSNMHSYCSWKLALVHFLYMELYPWGVFYYFQNNIYLTVMDEDMIFLIKKLYVCALFETAMFSVVDINECTSSPCMNGATCTDAVNSYTCGCVAGYMGTDCETGLSLTLASTRSLCSSMLYKNNLLKRIVHMISWYILEPPLRE